MIKHCILGTLPQTGTYLQDLLIAERIANGVKTMCIEYNDIGCSWTGNARGAVTTVEKPSYKNNFMGGWWEEEDQHSDRIRCEYCGNLNEGNALNCRICRAPF